MFMGSVPICYIPTLFFFSLCIPEILFYTFFPDFYVFFLPIAAYVNKSYYIIIFNPPFLRGTERLLDLKIITAYYK